MHGLIRCVQARQYLETSDHCLQAAMILLEICFEYFPAYSKSSIINNQQAKVIYQGMKIANFAVNACCPVSNMCNIIYNIM